MGFEKTNLPSILRLPTSALHSLASPGLVAAVGTYTHPSLESHESTESIKATVIGPDFPDLRKLKAIPMC